MAHAGHQHPMLRLAHRSYLYVCIFYGEDSDDSHCAVAAAQHFHFPKQCLRPFVVLSRMHELRNRISHTRYEHTCCAVGKV